MTEPSSAEILRRLEEVVRSVERLASTMEANYVRREVYEAKHEHLRTSLQADVKDVRDDVEDIKRLREKDGDRWKQLAFTVGGSLLLMLVTAAFAISNFMARGGLG